MKSLHFIQSLIMLFVLSHLAKVGISSPCAGEQSPRLVAVFLCPFKNKADLFRVAFSMADCYRETFGFARTCAGTANLFQSAAQCLAAKGSGYFLTQELPI